MRLPQKLDCLKCGQRLQPEDTAVIKVAQPRFQQRKHCCPHCGALVAIEIAPADDDDALPGRDLNLFRGIVLTAEPRACARPRSSSPLL